MKKADTSSTGLWDAIKSFPSKLKGGQDTPLTIPSAIDIFWSGLGAFCGILLLSGLTQLLEPAYNLPLLYASFGASAVLVFGVISSPLAQPRNFIGGQVLSAVVGCAIRLALQDVLWVSAALGMSLALVVMMLTKTVHPPGGATALIAATANPLRPWQGFQFVVCIGIGSVGMLLVALVFNNLHLRKRYPMFW
ncbi:g7419 [Coccomyxa elongata]